MDQHISNINDICNEINQLNWRDNLLNSVKVSNKSEVIYRFNKNTTLIQKILSICPNINYLTNRFNLSSLSTDENIHLYSKLDEIFTPVDWEFYDLGGNIVGLIVSFKFTDELYDEY